MIRADFLWELFAFSILGGIFMLAIACEGPKGPQGPAGSSCNVLQGEGFAIVTCGSTSALIKDGEDGINGQDAQNIEWVDPCPEVATNHPELLLKMGAAYFAVYASGQRIHLTRLIDDVNYRTTDGRACTFTLEDL